MQKIFEVKETRVEQWETEYGIPELGIYGTELGGLIQALANEVADLRKKNSSLSWGSAPDRSGGQFTDEEINRESW